MMYADRRGFLKIGMHLLGALQLIKYSEPIVAIDESKNDWIEDKGDFCIVKVPDFKTIAREVIDKPTILILGEASVVRELEIRGFVNIYAPRGGSITMSRFDASKMTTSDTRAVLKLNAKNIAISHNHIIGNGASHAYSMTHA